MLWNEPKCYRKKSRDMVKCHFDWWPSINYQKFNLAVQSYWSDPIKLIQFEFYSIYFILNAEINKVEQWYRIPHLYVHKNECEYSFAALIFIYTWLLTNSVNLYKGIGWYYDNIIIIIIIVHVIYWCMIFITTPPSGWFNKMLHLVRFMLHKMWDGYFPLSSSSLN